MEQKDSFRKYLAFIVFLAILVLAFMMIKPFITAFVAAAILAIVFYPAFNKVAKLYHSKRAPALVFVVLITAIIIIPLSIGGYFAFKQGFSLFQAAGEAGIITAISSKLGAIGSLDIGDSVGQAATAGASFLISNLSGIVSNVSTVVLSVIMFFISLYYFLKDGSNIHNWFEEILPFSKEDNSELIKKFKDASNSFVYAAFLVALLEGIAGGVIFSLFGISSPAFWAFVIFIFAFLPLLGPAIIWIPMTIFLFAQGQTSAAIGLGIASLVVMSGIDTFLRPKLIGDKMGIHPFVTFTGVIGGIVLLGFVGIIVGPLLLHFSIEFLRIYGK